MWYTYDELGRVKKRVKTNKVTHETTVENYAYDAAGNLIQAKSDVSYIKETSWGSNKDRVHTLSL